MWAIYIGFIPNYKFKLVTKLHNILKSKSLHARCRQALDYEVTPAFVVTFACQPLVFLKNVMKD